MKSARPIAGLPFSKLPDTPRTGSFVMGIFDKFQQPKSEFDKSFEDWAKNLFPGGRGELLFRADVAVRLSNGKLTIEDAARLCGMLKTRFHLASDVFDGRSNLGPNAAKLVEQVKNDTQHKLNTTEAAAITFYLIFDQVDNGVETYALLQNRLQAVYGSDSIGCDTDEIPGGLGEFGLDSTNPIPVRGIASSAIYLNCLRTTNGHKVEHQRMGSVTVPNIFGFVDEYEITQTDRILCRMYLSPHNRRISQRPPRGFILLWSSHTSAPTREAPQTQPTMSGSELPDWSDWATRLFTATAVQRNIELECIFDRIIDEHQEYVGGIAVFRKGTGPAKVKVNYTDLASWGYAFCRVFLDDLLHSPYEQDRRVAADMLKTAERDPDFRPWIQKIVTKAQQAGQLDSKLTVDDFLNDHPHFFMSSKITGRETGAQEEFLAQQAGEYFKRHAGESVGGFKQSHKELLSAVRLRWGNATTEDAYRLLHNRLFKDAPFHETHRKPARP